VVVGRTITGRDLSQNISIRPSEMLTINLILAADTSHS
jgi:hypothetical protein